MKLGNVSFRRHQWTRSHEGRGIRRRGISWIGIGVFVVLSVIVTAGAVYGFKSAGTSKNYEKPLTHLASRGQFMHVVTEDGEIESSSNVEVRCEVQSRNTSGTAILWIVGEGTEVKKGDLLVRLDSSALTNELNQQEKVCRTSEALVITAKAAVETAQISMEEYLDGTFKELEQTLLAEKATTEENLRRAIDYARYSEKLSAKGYVTPLQLEADQFAVEKARSDLAISDTKLEVLRNYTKRKTLSTLQANIDTAEANLRSEESGHKLDQDKLNLVQEQIAKCEIHSPSDGQVVYANQTSGRGNGNEILIQEGVLIRERQVIVRLPDPKKMQVKANISESRIDRVRQGQVALIHIDALPNQKLKGIVRRVDDYPVQGNWWSNVKEYATYIQIVGDIEGLRPGMTAEVEIQLASIPDVVQVPVQTILEREGHHFVLTEDNGEVTPHEVQIGTTNDKFVVIKEGIDANRAVVVNPRQYQDRVTFPSLPPVAPVQIAESEMPQEEAATAEATQVAANDAGDGKADDSKDGERKKRGDKGGKGGAAGAMAGMDSSQIVSMMMQRMDKDSDGKISIADELPEEGRDRMAQSDANKDGFIDTAELTAGIAKYRAQMGGGAGGPGGGGGSAAAGGSGGP